MTKMTKNDYELLASVFRDQLDYFDNHDKRLLWNLAEELADTLKTDNPHFNREAFLAACFGQSL